MSTGQSNREESRWELTQGRDPEAGADTEATELYCLQALLLKACSACLLIKPQDHQPRVGSTHNGLGPPHPSLTKQRPHRLVYT